MKQKLQQKIKLISLTFSALVVGLSTVIVSMGQVSALQATSRTLTIGSSVASASTTYTFSFALPSSTVLKSASFQICTTATGTCTAPAGFSSSSSTLPTQPTNLGDSSGWTVSTATADSLRLSKTGNVAAPTGTSTVTFGAVTNPSATNATFFARMTTYSDATWTTAVDTGTFASSTAGQVTITATIDETLTFTLASATVPLGALSSATTGTGTSTMSASTNATSGYAISVNGSTLTSGANTIAALGTNTASTQGAAQFGMNLMANTTPPIGSNVSGSGGGLPAANYNTANSFRFVTGETVASAAAATNANTYTVSYIANVPATQQAGAYSTTLTYIATATF